jgi:hypothetical protein
MGTLQHLQALDKSSHENHIVTVGSSASTDESYGLAEVNVFCVQRRRKRTSSGEPEAKKMAVPHTSIREKEVFEGRDQEAEVTHNHEKVSRKVFAKLDKANPDTGNIRGGQAYDHSSD